MFYLYQLTMVIVLLILNPHWPHLHIFAVYNLTENCIFVGILLQFVSSATISSMTHC